MLQTSKPTLNELNWMQRLYFQGVADGHFLMPDRGARYKALVERNFLSMVKHGRMNDFNLQAEPLVFRHQGKKIGYVVITDIVRIPDGREIHLFLVDQRWRGQGFGKQMLETVLEHWKGDWDLYIRCFPASTTMIHLIESHGFVYNRQNRDGSGVYIRSRESD